MPDTDTKPGFRLPWGAGERIEADTEDVAETAATPEPPIAEEHVAPDMIDAPPAVSAPARRSTKFMVDLSRAMQSASESARDETMAKFVVDSKTAIEEIQAASTVEVAALRQRADDDISAVRDWSKGEIARIREETETRIAKRKHALDGEIEASAAVIEARVARVTATVDAFRADMDEFFERLLAEQDPTRIATMAETMPDPPDLAGVAASVAEPVFQPFDPNPSLSVSIEPPVAVLEPEPPATDPAADAMAAAQAAMAARLGFAAAEADALAFSGDLDGDDGSAITDAPADVAQLPEGAADADIPPVEASPIERVSTRVIVVGLVSVASIATFKRGLSRSAGVSTVSVASGPDGEFIFTVEHEIGLDIESTATAVPGFEARVTGRSGDAIEVAARDPDTGD
ncbi:MAG: hypothetical protein ACJ779_10275 [Chloroflexota bacterium]